MQIHYKIGVASLLFVLSYTQAYASKLYTVELTPTLESDAATAIVKGLTHDFAGQLCARLNNVTGLDAKKSAEEWRKRNAPFLQAAGSAINAFAELHSLKGGESAKQDYLQQSFLQLAAEANKRVMYQMSGASLDNIINPSERTCAGLARMLRDGVADFENTPAETRALVQYMQQKAAQ